MSHQARDITKQDKSHGWCADCDGGAPGRQKCDDGHTATDHSDKHGTQGCRTAARQQSTTPELRRSLPSRASQRRHSAPRPLGSTQKQAAASQMAPHIHGNYPSGRPSSSQQQMADGSLTEVDSERSIQRGRFREVESASRRAPLSRRPRRRWPAS